MFYNINTSELLSVCPPNGYLSPNGSLVQGLDISDFETQKACGILPVKSDSPSRPENSYEDVSQRGIVIENDGVLITRVWVTNPTIVPIVPETISARQVRLWLIDNNINLANVENAINTIEDEKLRLKTLVEWEYAPYIERNHPLIETIASMLGLTSEQIDQAFIDGYQL